MPISCHSSFASSISSPRPPWVYFLSLRTVPEKEGEKKKACIYLPILIKWNIRQISYESSDGSYPQGVEDTGWNRSRREEHFPRCILGSFNLWKLSDVTYIIKSVRIDRGRSTWNRGKKIFLCISNEYHNHTEGEREGKRSNSSNLQRLYLIGCILWMAGRKEPINSLSLSSGFVFFGFLFVCFL